MALVFDGLLYLHVRHCKYVTTQKQTAFTIMHFKIETTNKKTERYNKIQNIYDVGRETEWMSENRIQNEYETMNCNNNYNINSMVRDSLMMLWCRKRYVQLYCCIATTTRSRIALQKQQQLLFNKAESKNHKQQQIVKW